MNQVNNPAPPPWSELIQPEKLMAWMDSRGIAGEGMEAAHLLTGGSQNLLLRFTRGGQGFVLRRPPQHPRQDGNATIRREADVLTALGGSSVPHPRLIARCNDPEVLGACFFLMEPVDGFTATIALEGTAAGDPEWRHQMGLSVIDALVAIGSVDWTIMGLSDPARLDGYVQRQVGRWRSTLEKYSDYEGWPGPAGLAGLGEVQRWLEANCPSTFHPGVVHGDFHLGNIMFRRDSPQVAAIIDWELTSIGEPLLDLGWLLATWPDENGRSVTPSLDIQPSSGLPTEAELIARYAQVTSRDLINLNWWVVLACFKLAILLEGTYARACAGRAPSQVGEQLHHAALCLMSRALTRISGSRRLDF